MSASARTRGTIHATAACRTHQATWVGTANARGKSRSRFGFVRTNRPRAMAASLARLSPTTLPEAPMIPPKRILVGVDFSECSRAALAFGARLAVHAGAALDVLHVQDATLTVAARAVHVNLE